MDIGINSNDGSFKFRVCGIVKQGGKTLVMKIQQNEFYCLPGGHVEIGELAKEAIVREMKEELTFPVEIKKTNLHPRKFVLQKRWQAFQ